MVSLIPNYAQQRYVLNSDDDSGDIEFHNGDIVYLMDVQQESIYSEADNQWYPVPTGGGGGEVFEIHLAGTSVFPDPPTWEADKTPTQIYQAFAAGKTLVAIVPNSEDPPFRLTLCRIDEHLSVFFAIDENFLAHMVSIEDDVTIVATQPIS